MKASIELSMDCLTVTETDLWGRDIVWRFNFHPDAHEQRYMRYAEVERPTSEMQFGAALWRVLYSIIQEGMKHGR